MTEQSVGDANHTSPIAVGWEEVSWHLPGFMEGRVDPVTRARLEATPYRAAVPASIGELNPLAVLDTAAVRDITEAEHAIRRFDALAASLPIPMPAVLLRTESSSSSQIERLSASARNLAMAVLGHDASTGDNARLVAQNVTAMRRALGITGTVTTDAILDIHQALMGESDPDIAGMFRTQPVWVGAADISPHGADFVPPQYPRIIPAMQDLIRFASTPHASPLAAAVIAHAQFETIHPFVDGNGRTGRTLIHTMLHQAKVTTTTTVPISAGLLGDVNGYFAGLTSFRDGDARPLMRTFATAANRAVLNGRVLADESRLLREDWGMTVKARSDSTAWRLADHLFAQPVVSSEYVETTLGVSRQAAYNAIETLVSAGVLSQSSRDRRNRLWQAPAVLMLMDDFAKRAVRRTT